MILGVDVGGVLVDAGPGRQDTLLGEKHLKTPPLEGAILSVAALNAKAFRDRVWIVSKCKEPTERRTREWMRHIGFHETTGIPESRLRFCRERAEKALIARELGLTHFVDDRLEVLHHMAGIVPVRVLFRPRTKEALRFKDSLADVYLADDWIELASWLLEGGR